MKAIFSALLCYLLVASPCLAIKGGPVYPGSSTFSTTGTFAGVLLPDEFATSNSIGLFTLTLPTVGLGTGTLVIFQTGQTYNGTIQALGDPDTGILYGQLYATFPYVNTVQTGTDDNGNPIFTTETVVAVASGRLAAEAVANSNVFSSASTRITGTADVQFSLFVNVVDSEVLYDVFGFQQG